MKTYEYRQFGLENLVLAERDKPQAAAGQAVVKFRAASLNYRDLLFAKGVYNPRARFPAVPLSDGAGEVVAAGDKVTRWKVGDRVCPIFMQGWIDGERSLEKARTSLGGGELDGVLREYGAFDESGLVRIPDHLSFEEAATLPCAAVTAWDALVCVAKLKAGDTILTLGTGGVSVFAIQFAKMHGARVIATSSSDEKLEEVRELGADEIINYKKTPDWDHEVLRMTDGTGVDCVVEVGGAGTLAKSVAATRMGGLICVIGVLASGGGFNPVQILMRGLCLQGIFVGSRRMFEDMNRAIAVNRLRPVISKTFNFDQAREALAYMESGSHFGKIVLNF
ncbi:MAG: NAD(P)-dependent alcohol dehydrogenase [Candidatus Omnitrophica bacterium]|nr:NAD(P)-dependent alcohol dehydrogenase [Candidatus Omnitrophota bacterium]